MLTYVPNRDHNVTAVVAFSVLETDDKGKELVAVTPPALVLYIKTWKWKWTWMFGYTGNSASVLGPVRPSRLWEDSKAFQ